MADERNRMLEQLNTDDWQECRQSVLIVDDSAMNRRMLTEILGGRFDTAEATSGEECLHLLEENRDGISIVLLDIHMEGMDGFAVLEEMDRQKMLEDIPVIMISSEDKVDAMRRAFDLGASDYISRPFDARVVCQRIGNTMRLYAKQRRLCAAVEKQIREADQNSRIMLALLNRVMEKRNGESRNHVRRIQIITALLLAQLAQKNGQHWLTGSVRRRITLAAALHDIGKIELETGCYAIPPRLRRKRHCCGSIQRWVHRCWKKTVPGRKRLLCRRRHRSAAGTTNDMMAPAILMGWWENRSRWKRRWWGWQMLTMH